MHAHPLGVFIKSNEDTMLCMDTLRALELVMLRAHGTPLPLYRFLVTGLEHFCTATLLL